MTAPKVLVAGIGNIFLGDDAFGCAVARVLAERQLGAEVSVVDFGIRGLDLVYALLDDWEQVILVDAVPRGEAPGTLYVIEPELPDAASGPPPTMLDAHQMDPVRMLRLAVALGAKLPKLWLVGCEPSPLEDDDAPSGLSPPVESALAGAANLVESIIGQRGDPADRPFEPAAASAYNA
jgi:hydrogenase maturation protease